MYNLLQLNHLELNLIVVYSIFRDRFPTDHWFFDSQLEIVRTCHIEELNNRSIFVTKPCTDWSSVLTRDFHCVLFDYKHKAIFTMNKFSLYRIQSVTFLCLFSIRTSVTFSVHLCLSIRHVHFVRYSQRTHW
jgi:hypothetical protein